MGEFELIEQYFKQAAAQGRAVLGIGDDCALWRPTPGHDLALSCDMLVEGRHFLPDVSPESLGHKALAVNLSDLAACGARPQAFLLAMALPSANPSWLADFSRGLLRLAHAHGCELIGGDTTAGPLNLSITVMGEVPVGQALLRSTAQAGDDIYVSGTLGDARLALEVHRGRLQLPAQVLQFCRERMDRPSPRVALGLALRNTAHACADISDGLLGDLGHILKASRVGAELDVPSICKLCASAHNAVLDAELLLTCTLAGGDDYELVFTAPPSARDHIARAAQTSNTRVTRVGRITATEGLVLRDGERILDPSRFSSFDHFA
ncbi:MAG: Thiamine-monophosphate kinase [Pseudomonadota bacterium]|jgi:thiamine-monophosphate kinase